MVDRFLFVIVVISAIAFLFLVLPILVQTLWRTRDMRGLGVALLIKLIVGDVWMILFLGYLVVNRIWELGRLNDGVLILLALVLLARPTTFSVWYRRWERGIRKEQPHG